MINLLSTKKINNDFPLTEGIFSVKNITLKDMNNFRRILISEINVKSIFVVKIIENETVQTSAELSHRFGLLPVFNNLLDPLYKKKYYKCDINVYNDTDDFMEVFSDSIELLDSKNNKTGIFPIFPGIKITELLPGKSLSCFLYINSNNGNDHIRYKCCKANYKENDDFFELKIVTFGQLELKDIFRKAIKIYKDLYNKDIGGPF